jgi:hypothetical protein
MPDRLAEIKNVKDFGAVGNGVTDDRAAIQATIDWTSGADRGTIYFPPASATYLVGSPGITLNYDGPLTIAFRGEGNASKILSKFNGFQFTRSLATASNEADIVFDRMAFTNGGATGGNCRIGSAKKVAFRDCQFGGHIVYTGENTDGGLCSSNTLFSQCLLARGGDVPGSRGIIMAGGCIEGTDVRSFDVAYRIAGSGTTIWGGRSERNNTAIEFGVGNASEARGAATDIGAQGIALIGHTFEGNWYTLDFLGTTEGFFAVGIYILGHGSSNSGVTPGENNSQIAIWIRANKLNGALFSGVGLNSLHDIAGVKIEDPTSRPNILFLNCLDNVVGGPTWIDSTKAYAARFLNCWHAPLFHFNGLPGAGDRQEGDEFDIDDGRRASDNAPITSADWGVPVTGGGSSHCRVRFNGTNWTVIGV